MMTNAELTAMTTTEIKAKIREHAESVLALLASGDVGAIGEYLTDDADPLLALARELEDRGA